MVRAHRELASFVKQTVDTASEAQITFLAAAVAYYAFVSLVPLLAVLLVASAAVGGQALVERLLAATDEFLTPETQILLTEALIAGTGRVGTTAVGSLVIAWSALKVFRGIDRAFALVYGTAGSKTIVTEVVDGVIAVVAIVAGLAAMSLVGIGLRILPLGPLVGPAATILVFATLVVAFFPLYYVFPDRPIGLTEALPGAILAAVGWTALGSAFHVYVSVAGGVALYGVLGGLLLLVTLLYGGAIVLMLGVVVNAVATDRQLQQAGGRPLDPSGMTDEDTTGGPEEFDPAGRASDDPEDGDRTVDGLDRDGERAATGDDQEGKADDAAALRAEIEALRSELEEFEDDIEGRTVRRESIEGELKRYVRRRQRRGHARGWGPYLVLLYGTAMTIGAFYFLPGGWSILAMIVIWLSTLGLYVVMIAVGAGLSLLGVPGRLRDRLQRWRS